MSSTTLDDAALFDDTYIGIREEEGDLLFRVDPLADTLNIDEDPDDLITYPSHDGPVAVGGVFQDRYFKDEDGGVFVTAKGAIEIAKDHCQVDRIGTVSSWTAKVEKGELPPDSPRQIWTPESAPGQLLSLFRGHEVRVVEDAGTPWIVLSDVADALGYSYTRNVERRVSDFYKGRQRVTTPGGEQEMTCARRQGVLEAVLSLSPHDPEKDVIVEEFKHWALDVLVEVLETGSYQAPHASYDRFEMRQILKDWVELAADQGRHFHEATAWGQLYQALDLDLDRLAENRGTSTKLDAMNSAELYAAWEKADEIWGHLLD